ncbi:MAG: hypothetical protein R6W94_10645, partial [Spirochaetia bacterium]
NLLYVAVTRAMDNLQLFLPQQTDVAPIRVLGEAAEKLAELEQQADEAAVGKGSNARAAGNAESTNGKP